MRISAIEPRLGLRWGFMKRDEGKAKAFTAEAPPAGREPVFPRFTIHRQGAARLHVSLITIRAEATASALFSFTQLPLEPAHGLL